MYTLADEKGTQVASGNPMDILQFFSDNIEIEIENLDVSDEILSHSSHKKMEKLVSKL